MTRIYNKSAQVNLRRRLRKSATPAETMLWSRIRRQSLAGHKFRRQYGVGPYVIDFYCPELRLGIEVIGDVHAFPDQMNHDIKRMAYLNKLQIGVAIYTNDDVLKNMDVVLEDLLRRCLAKPPLSPLLGKEGRQTKPEEEDRCVFVPSPSQGEGEGGVSMQGTEPSLVRPEESVPRPPLSPLLGKEGRIT